MIPGHPERILIRVLFFEGVLGKLVLEELKRNPDLKVSVFRGRRTPEATSFELELEGPSLQIKEFARWSSEREVSRGSSVAEVARLGNIGMR